VNDYGDDYGGRFALLVIRSGAAVVDRIPDLSG
jgi:hypothetical protein